MGAGGNGASNGGDGRRGLPSRYQPGQVGSRATGGAPAPRRAPSFARPSGRSGQGADAAPGADLLRYWQVLRNRWALALGIFAVVVVGVGAGTLLQRPVYRASGTLEIRKQGADVVPVEALFELARISDQHLQTQYAVLRSPALARRVVTDLGLHEVEEFQHRSGASVETAVGYFLGRLSVSPVQQSRLVQVSFESEDPALAARVVNAVFDAYMNMRADAHQTTVERLAAQADSVRGELVRAESRLQEFVRSNELFLAERSEGARGSLIDERLRQLQEQITQAEAERFTLEARFAQARGSSQVLDSRVVQTLAGPLAELEAEYAKLRTTFTDSFPRVMQLRRQIESLRRQMNDERTRVVSEMGSEYRAANQRLANLRASFEEQKALGERLASLGAEYQMLKREADGHQQLYALLRQKEKEADVGAAIALTEVGVVDAAVPPVGPVRPNPRRNVALATVAGLLLGICGAFVREYTDPKLRRVEELEGLDVPVLALIPSARSEPGALRRSRLAPGMAGNGHSLTVLDTAAAGWVRIDRDDWRRSALAEGFGNLRTSVLFSGAPGAALRSLLVTSVQPGEGKTTVSLNLAISLARLGRRVLLIDADMRRPSLHRAFSIPAGPGLAEHLAGSADWRQATVDVGVPNLRVLPAGGSADAPDELLSSDRMIALVGEAEEAHDFVVIDSPALMVNVADARILSSRANGIVMVARGGVTPREVLRRLVGHIPNLVGVVMNDMEESQLPEYYQDYRFADADVDGNAWPARYAGGEG